jgi:hypothetical protein
MECTCLRSQLDRLAKPDLSQGRWIDARRGDWQRFAMSKRLTKGAHLLDAPTIRRVVKSGQMGIYHLGYFQILVEVDEVELDREIVGPPVLRDGQMGHVTDPDLPEDSSPF